MMAQALGRELAQKGKKLVYGGGSVGLMGTVANAALEQGGYVIGVIPEMLVRHETKHNHLSETHIVATMHERKALMAKFSDAFVALPGGFGTYDELIEVITWKQLGIHSKPIAVLNVEGYFDPLLHIIEHGVATGFIRSVDLKLVQAVQNVPELFGFLETYQPESLRPKWLDSDQI
jgi:hypothetical protein